MSEKQPTRNQLEIMIDVAARQSALDNETIYNLRAEIDMYDRTCAEVRNELTAAGIPELTEDRLYVVPLAKRVRSLVAFRGAWKKMAEELENYADHKYLCNTGKPHGICNCGMLQAIKQLIALKESGGGK